MNNGKEVKPCVISSGAKKSLVERFAIQLITLIPTVSGTGKGKLIVRNVEQFIIST